MHEWIGPILNSLQLIREFLFIADMVLVSISESAFQNVFFKFKKLNHESTHKKNITLLPSIITLSSISSTNLEVVQNFTYCSSVLPSSARVD